jgi:SAM-dependent methyltransferase
MFKDFIDNYIIDYKEEIEDVLEYGCGPGPVLADLLEEIGFNIYKYDPFFYPDFDYKSKKYDLITSTEVFEHFFDPKNEISKLVQLIKPGKYLAVMTSFHQGIDHFKDWWYKRDPTHVSFYNIKTFQYIENNYPLKIVKTKNNKGILFKKID